ncbi:MAG: germination protein YpeB [Firmicutes bacterium]|nr:germination protein YpeB [Bacillota bacterium]
MKNKLFIPILSLALVCVCGWGYSQYQAKRQWEINAENQYQRAFEELTGHVNNLETQLTKSLVAASVPQFIRLMTDGWREANSCQEDIGQLPLTSLDLSRTKTFLASAGTFCLNTAQNQLADDSRLNKAQWDTIRKFRNQCRTVTENLQNLREEFYNKRAQWLEVDRLGTLSAAAPALNENKVTKAFLMLEDGLRRVPDIEFEGNNLDLVPKPTGLTGQNITAQEAVNKSKQILGPDYSKARFKYSRIIKGDFPSHLVTAYDPDKREPCQVSVSVKGGHLVWMLTDREVPKKNLNLDQCEAKAKSFFQQREYPPMEVVSREESDNVAILSMAPRRNDVLKYPELIKCQVAQDNGEVLGVDAVSYLTFNDPNAPQQKKPGYTETQIRKNLNPNLKVARIQKAEVLNEMYNKVPCYEVEGTEGTDRFLIYYNAETGKEEKIRRTDENGNEIQ